MPSVPRKASNSSVSLGFPPRQEPTAASLSQTSSRGAAPMRESKAQCPAIRSGPWREGIISANIIREYPETITSTGGCPTYPAPSGMAAGGNHRSHCTRTPGSYCVREAGSGGR